MEIIQTIPKTPSFTEGIVLHKNKWYESSGLQDQSYLSIWNKNHSHQNFIPHYFAEDITLINETIYMLTYRDRVLLEFDLQGNLTRSSPYPWDGWGLCHDPYQMWASDGSSILRRFSPYHYEDTMEIKITRDGKPVDRLNAMDWFPAGSVSRSGNRIGICHWLTPEVLWVDPFTGQVVETWNTESLTPPGLPHNPDVCMNGIFNDGSGVWITGKYWDRLYKCRYM